MNGAVRKVPAEIPAAFRSPEKVDVPVLVEVMPPLTSIEKTSVPVESTNWRKSAVCERVDEAKRSVPVVDVA